MRYSMSRQQALSIMFQFNGTYLSTLAGAMASKSSVTLAHKVAMVHVTLAKIELNEYLPEGYVKDYDNGECEVHYTSRSGNEYLFILGGKNNYSFAIIEITDCDETPSSMREVCEKAQTEFLNNGYEIDYFGFPTEESVQKIWEARNPTSSSRRDNSRSRK